MLGIEGDVRNANDAKVKVERLHADARFSNVDAYDGAVVGVHPEQNPGSATFGLFATHLHNQSVVEEGRHKVGDRSAAESGHSTQAHPVQGALQKEQS